MNESLYPTGERRTHLCSLSLLTVARRWTQWGRHGLTNGSWKRGSYAQWDFIQL